MSHLLRSILSGSARPFFGSSLGRGAGCHPRLVLAVLIICGTLAYHYLGTTEYQNDFTRRTQRLAFATAQEEVALGLQSAPLMIREMGGQSRDAQGEIGRASCRERV